MEFKRSQLELNVYGETYKIKFPTLGELASYEATAGENVNTIEMTASFLDKLGLPKKIVLGMEPSHVQKVVEALTEKKN